MKHLRPMRAGMAYGYALMEIDFKGFFFLFNGYPEMIGHIGATSTFMYYIPEMDIYLVGGLNQTKAMGQHIQLAMKIIKLWRKIPQKQPRNCVDK